MIASSVITFSVSPSRQTVVTGAPARWRRAGSGKVWARHSNESQVAHVPLKITSSFSSLPVKSVIVTEPRHFTQKTFARIRARASFGIVLHKTAVLGTGFVAVAEVSMVGWCRVCRVWADVPFTSPFSRGGSVAKDCASTRPNPLS